MLPSAYSLKTFSLILQELSAMITGSHRERMLRAFDFANPDRLPVYYHPSTAGLQVHGQKLLDLFRAYPPDNDLEFDGLPQPDPAGVARL